MKSLRTDCSTGYDQIPAKYIKTVADHLTSPVTHIINSCITSSSFPDQWKISRVCPIPKVTNPTTLADYRPISILPILSKVFERTILGQMLEFIEKRTVYSPNQAGFRKGHSTTTILLKLKSDIKSAMKKGEVTLAVFADFSKAFDTVDYPTLFKNLHELGFSKSFIELLYSYLYGRKQVVQVNDKYSQFQYVQFGVPQGSILGPILFNLYVTCLSEIGSSNYIQYADDTTIYRTAKPTNLTETAASMQSEMNQLENWCQESNLHLNAKKTKLMVFSSTQLSRAHNIDNHQVVISSSGQPIERVTAFKLLGIHFNQRLSWDTHINKVIQSCMATLRSLKQFKRSANFPMRKTLMQSLILTRIDYCSAVFSDATACAINRLQKIQRAAASFVLGKYCNDKDILQLQWLPVNERISLSLTQLAYKSLNDFENWQCYLKLKRKEQRHHRLRADNKKRKGRSSLKTSFIPSIYTIIKSKTTISVRWDSVWKRNTKRGQRKNQDIYSRLVCIKLSAVRGVHSEVLVIKVRKSGK